jgi:S1-C subfamily serine protease
MYPAGLSFGFRSSVANKKLLFYVLQVQESSTELSEIKVGEIITHVDGVPFSNAAEVCTILISCGILGLSKLVLNVIVFWY